MSEVLPTWKHTWRNGFLPHLSVQGLTALRSALLEDSPTVVQGATTVPPPLACTAHEPVEACCPVTYCGVVDLGGIGEVTVGEAEEGFALACHACDNSLGEPAGCRWFLNHIDEIPRDVMIKEMLEELEYNLATLHGLEIP